MTPVVGTAGHIDHGKTSLLRALTGIDADRLPEEQRRGMTIDVGYAHVALPNGDEIDFVDVPGHDRLVGNMLVGAGEVDAALLVVAADDGPRAQTLEHLELLDALAIRHGIAVVTKADLAPRERVDEVVAAVRALLARTTLAEAPVLHASAADGTGVDDVRAALVELRDRVVATGGTPGPTRLAVDRVFSPKGRGTVVTGSLRGGRLARDARLRVEPGGRSVRVREVQVHGTTVDEAGPGRTALNLAGVDAGDLARGTVLTDGAGVEVSDRLLVRLAPAVRLAGDGRNATATRRLPRPGDRLRAHVGTDQVDALVGSLHGPADAVLRLERPVAVAAGDRFVLRRPSPGTPVAGGIVLDPHPPRGVSRRRASQERLDRLATAVTARDADAAAAAGVELHGALPLVRGEAIAGAFGARPASTLLRAGSADLAPDVAAAVATHLERAVDATHRDHPLERGVPLATARAVAAAALRRLVTVDRNAAPVVAAALVDAAVAAGRLTRDADRVAIPGRAGGLTADAEAAMDRVESALSGPTPPSLEEAARAAGCPPEGVRALLTTGRIVRLTDDVAFAARALGAFEALAVERARTGPLTPAAFRDAIGSSRKYVVAILEDLDRRGVLRRTADGHVPGPTTTTPPPVATR